MKKKKEILVSLLVYCLVSQIGVAHGQDFVQEDINNLDLESILGGPLQAVITAQAATARTTLDFINDIMFTTDELDGTQQIRMTQFSHSVIKNGSVLNTAITLPLAVLFPYPFLEIEDVNIALNVKLNGVTNSQSSSQSSSALNVNNANNLMGFKAQVSTQSLEQTDDSTSQIQQDFSLAVKLHVTSSQLPKGMEKMLELFEMLVIQK